MNTEPPRDAGSHLVPRGAGGLLQTEVERVDLGEHGGRRLHARVEHRTLRVALGQRWHGSITLGRRRALTIEVTSADGAPSPSRYDVAIPRPLDPWPQYTRRVLAVAGAGWLTVRLVRAAQRRRRRVPLFEEGATS